MPKNAGLLYAKEVWFVCEGCLDALSDDVALVGVVTDETC